MTKKPRTPAQALADYRKTFPRRVNERRCELIAKESGEPDPERDGWLFSEHPGWEEECARRRQANLSDDERAELAECTRIVDEWSERMPIWGKPMVDDLQALMDRLGIEATDHRTAGED